MIRPLQKKKKNCIENIFNHNHFCYIRLVYGILYIYFSFHVFQCKILICFVILQFRNFKFCFFCFFLCFTEVERKKSVTKRLYFSSFCFKDKCYHMKESYCSLFLINLRYVCNIVCNNFNQCRVGQFNFFFLWFNISPYMIGNKYLSTLANIFSFRTYMPILTLNCYIVFLFSITTQFTSF